MNKLTRHHKKLNFIYIMTGIIACFIIMFAFPWVGSFISDDSGYYVLVLDGKEIGVAPSKKIIEEAVLNARLKLNEEADSIVYVEPTIEIIKENKLFGTMEMEANLEDKVYKTLKESSGLTKTQAYVVSIDGFTVILENKDDIVKLLSAAKEKYDPNNEFKVDLSETSEGIFSAVTYCITKVDIEDNNAATVLASEDASAVADVDPTSGANDGVIALSFGEQVEILETCADIDSIMTLDEAINAVTKESESNQTYVVQSGDCLSSIAADYSISLEKLVAINPGLSETSTIGVGDQITITVPEPELSVIVQEERTYEEAYSCDVQYVDDNTMFRGQEVVVDSGTPGYRKVTADISFRNGEETGRVIKAQTLISESSPRIIRKGTLTPPTYIKPMAGGSVSSPFGWRWGSMHQGVDWFVPQGTNVFASCDGVVVSAGWAGGYGYCVVLRHVDGKQTRYAHLSAVLVSPGQSVAQCQQIGLSGSTGNSTGPHLHFEIIVNGVAQDPLNYVQP